MKDMPSFADVSLDHAIARQPLGTLPLRLKDLLIRKLCRLPHYGDAIRDSFIGVISTRPDSSSPSMSPLPRRTPLV
jgi:hypothetical protein